MVRLAPLLTLAFLLGVQPYGPSILRAEPPPEDSGKPDVPPPPGPGGGGGSGPAAAEPDPDAAGKDCGAEPFEGEDAVVMKAYADSLSDKEWPEKNGLQTETWESYGKEERLAAIREAVRLQRCRALAKIKAYRDHSMSTSYLGARQLCGQPPETMRKWTRWASESRVLEGRLKTELPYGYASLDEIEKGDLDELPAMADSFTTKIRLVDQQCGYGRRKLEERGAAKAVKGAKGRFGGKLDQASLDRGFENMTGRKGAAVADGRAPRTAKEQLALLEKARTRGSASKGFKTKAPPKAETFESLTEGIRFHGPDKVPGLFGEKKNPKKAVFEKALHHIYSIPEGKKVLRDLQSSREAWGERFRKSAKENKAELPELRKSLEAAEQELRDHPKKQAELLKKSRGRKGDIYLSPPDYPTGRMPTADHQVDRCPPGMRPVVTNGPRPGDMSCVPAGQKTRIMIATGDPFQPYKEVRKCPNGETPAVVNWPHLGDMSCESVRLRGSVDRLKKQIEGMKMTMKIGKGGAKPVISVDITECGELKGGYARPLQYQLWKGEDGSLYHLNRVCIDKDWLDDKNASRPVDKVMIHEFRHVADDGLFQAEMQSNTSWMLGEDRAFLSEAKAVMEQKPGMRGEPRSRTLEIMEENTVRPLLENPNAARMQRIASPLYMWHVSHADLGDPDTALRGRLSQAYNMLAYGDQDIRKEIDPTGELAAACGKARKPYTDPKTGLKLFLSPAEAEKLFIRLAENSRFAMEWKSGVESIAEGLKKEGKEAPAWKKPFQEMEAKYWSDLESFAARYRPKAPGRVPRAGTVR